MARAQDDFYIHINKKWLDANPCPNDYSRWGTFEELSKVNEEQLREILNNTTDSTPAWNCVQILWEKGQNEEDLNSSPFSDVLGAHFKSVSEIDSVEKLVSLFIEWYKVGIPSPITLGPHPDLKNSDFMILALDRCAGGLGLQDRDVYFDDNMKEKQEKYKEYLLTLTNHVKSQIPTDYFGDTEKVYELEERLAEACLPKVDRREPYKMYNPHSVEQLSQICPNVDWEGVLAKLGISLKPEEFIVVKEIEFMKQFNTCLQDVPLDTWKHYLAMRLMSCLAKYLDDKCAIMQHDFYGKVLSGQEEQKPRWKRVYHTINSIIGEIVGKKYIEKYFPEESKTCVLDMIKRMMTVLEARIKELPWMEDATKLKALKKLSTFTIKIGFPDKWEDFSGLRLEEEEHYCLNILRCREWDTMKDLGKCYKPVDKSEWHMTPQTVNAYYNPTQNEIVFPAGIIQPPMFDKTASIAVNFGGIGAVICHEITHGFDDKGAKFDHAGNLADWWTETDTKRFEACSEKLKTHFSEYVVEGMHVKGDLCLGENIADLGGLSISLEALSKLMEEEGATEEEKLKEKRKVFRSWAEIWRNNIKPDEAKRRIILDPHSPGHLRVNGIVKNVAEFYDLFSVSEGDEMFLKPESRAKIW